MPLWTASRAPREGRLSAGTPAVGALFHDAAGRLGGHFCTASVVNSPAGDLVITAAHCVTGVATGQLAFVPGYHDGREPYGTWQVTRVFVDQAWAGSQDPDHDVAFLVVHLPGTAAPVQALTGGERLGAEPPAAAWVHVIGYPRTRERPLTCQGPARPFGAGQQEFACAGYTGGTSGGPILAHFDPGTGEGTVIGVIGGYEQGGDTPAVSYSARFGPAVRALYETAAASS
jgi:V8-like Glu-specific endopeptidase